MIKKTLSVALIVGTIAFQTVHVYAGDVKVATALEAGSSESVQSIDAGEASETVKSTISNEPSAGVAGSESMPGDVPANVEDQQSEKLIGIVTLQSGNLNVRKGPSIEDEIIGKLPNGSQVEVLEQFEEWVSIPHDGAVAYVSKPYLKLVQEQLKPRSIGDKVVVLDPGHGGIDPGATPKKNLHESDIVWDYTFEAKSALEKAGYIVYLTRTEDTSCTNYKKSQEDLACRAAFAKKVDGDIFISIHADANPSKKFRGTVTFYNARDDFDGAQNPFPEQSKRLAEIVHRQVQPVMGSTDRGVQNKNYYVNRNNTVPSVLVELAVLTNASDLKLILDKNRPAKFASSLTQAVNQYFQTNSHD